MIKIIARSYLMADADEAEAVIKRMNELVDENGFATLADLHELIDAGSASYKDEKEGWTSMEGVHHHPNQSGEELVFPPPYVPVLDRTGGKKMGRRPRTPVETIKYQHEMPVELADWLDEKAARMGTSRRGLINVLLYQMLEKEI
jgi:hypothetical protein